MKSAILLFILGSFGLPVANAADYGSEHQGFVKVQQALDYAEFQLVVNKALEQLRLFQKVRFIVIQDPSVVSVKDDGELAKHLETFHQFCASGGLISFLDDRRVQLYVGSLWAGAPKKALSLGLNPPWPICLFCDPPCCDKNAKPSRILLAPDGRLPNDFVFIGASEMPQEPFGCLLVTERGKGSAFWAAPGVQSCNSIT